MPPADAAWLEQGWSTIAGAARQARVAVILGTERIVDGALLIRAGHRPGRNMAGFSGQGPARPVRGSHVSAGAGGGSFNWCADVRHRHLPRGMAVSRDGPLGRPARRTGRVPPALSRGRPGQLPAYDIRRSREHLPREGAAVPRRREHLLLRDRQLRERRIADHVGDRPSGRDAARYQPYGEAGLLVAEIDLAEATRALALRCKEPL